jgi:L-lactate dehydrogenase complex protein LldG
MEESLTKEKILKKIRSALIEKTANPYPKLDVDYSFFEAPNIEKELVFAQNLIEQGGYFLYCDNHLDFVEDFLNLCENKKWKQFLCTDKALKNVLNQVSFEHDIVVGNSVEVYFTTAECVTARNVSLVFSNKQTHLHALNKAKALIVLIDLSQVVFDLKEVTQLLKLKYNNQYPAEVHAIGGPYKCETNPDALQEVYVFLIENQFIQNLDPILLK